MPRPSRPCLRKSDSCLHYVWKNPAAGDPYRISLIPTQVFFDERGRELHRHEGFIVFSLGLLVTIAAIGGLTAAAGRTMGDVGPWANYLVSLVFGIALGPCTFAYMAPVLGVTFAVAASSALYGVLLILLFGVGHCSLIVVAGASAGWVRRYLQWSEASRGVTYLRYASGWLVLAGGLYLVYSA